MSRTDAHRPGWVKDKDPTLRRYLVPHHNHFELDEWDSERRRHLVRRIAPCDLDVYESRRGCVYTRCEYTWRGPGHLYSDGCRGCTSHYPRRQEHRRQRTAWRSLRQQLLAAVDRDDIDVPPPARSW